MTGELVQLGWMTVVLVVAWLAFVRSGQFGGARDSVRLSRLESQLSQMPSAENIVERLSKLEVTPVGAPKMVSTLNAHSIDLLDVKQAVADLRVEIGKIRTRASLGSLGG